MCLKDYFNISLRSTVEFAREVAENKAQEDTAKAIEAFGGGGGGDNDVIVSKVGSHLPPKSPPTISKVLSINLLY